MVRKQIAKYFGYPFQDFYNHTDILSTLKFLRESQYWEESKLHEFRLEKLKNLIEFAYRNVPYYESLFNALKLKPCDIRRMEDLKKIPVLTKEIVRAENMNLVARNFDMKYVKKSKTGGTTGAPILVYKDTTNRSFTWASYYRWYDWMGIEYCDKSATLWGAKTVLTRSFTNEAMDACIKFIQNKLIINSFEMREETMLEIYKKLANFSPTILKGYLSSLINLAEYMERNSLERLQPKVLSSTTETLLPHNRKYLEKVYNAPLFDQYGCGELSAISYECAQHNGLHINQEHMICEILDEDSQSVTGVSGRVVGTDLDNYIMPFIRYENGDLATLSDRKCSCGINQPLINSIDGRAIDTIILKNGSKVHGVFFTDILFELGIPVNTIQRFQVYQNRSGEIEFRIEAAHPLGKFHKNNLLESLKKFFIKIDLVETQKLENELNGKYRYIINDLVKEQTSKTNIHTPQQNYNSVSNIR